MLAYYVSIYSEVKKWEGLTNENGKISIEYTLPQSEVFFLQSFIFVKDNWREIPIFWNDTTIWADLGTPFKSKKYRISLYIYSENKVE